MRLDRVHETLAAVEPSEGYTAEQVGPLLEDRLREISEIVFIVLRWDRTYQQLVEWAELAGCHCTVLVVGEPDPEAQDSGRRTEDGTRATVPSSVIGHPSSDCRYVSADDILAGRRASL